MSASFQFDFTRGKGRIQKDIGQNLHAELEVGPHDIQRDGEGIIPAIGTETASDPFDVVSDFLSAAGFSPLEKGSGIEARDAIGLLGLGKKATTKDRAYGNKRDS